MTRTVISLWQFRIYSLVLFMTAVILGLLVCPFALAQTPNVTVQFESSDYFTSESAKMVTVKVTLSGDPGQQTVKVNYSTSNGSAEAPGDYTSANGTITFDPGETEKTFNVTILDDTEVEGAESFTIGLSNPVNADLGTPETTTVEIMDDDTTLLVEFSSGSYSHEESAGTAIITVVLNGTSSQDVKVDYATLDSTAVDPDDYTATSGTVTIPANETSATFEVIVNDDSIYEETEYVGLILSNPNGADLGSMSIASLSIIDDENPPIIEFDAADYTVNEADGTVEISVTILEASEKDATVDFTLTAGTAEAVEDYVATTGTVVIPAGDSQASFTISIVDDLTAEDDETFTIDLSNPVDASLGQSTATVTILDDDTPPYVQFTRSSDYIGEAEGPAYVEVVLSTASDQEVTVDYATVDGTATAYIDYDSAIGTLTFAAGETQKSVIVPITDDTEVEDNEDLTVSLSNEINAYLGSPYDMLLTIVDNSSDPVVVFTPDPLWLCPSQDRTLTAEVTPQSASSQITFESSDTDTATVSGSAPTLTVSGVAIGTATISAIYNTQAISTATVHVDDITVKFTPSEVELTVDQEVDVAVAVTPSAAADQVTFQSSDTSIIDVNGGSPTIQVTGKGPGEAYMVAYLETKELAEKGKAAVFKLGLKVNGESKDQFVLVSPAGAADRPSAKVTLTLEGPAGKTKEITLTTSGSGAVDFEDDSPDVTVGTPKDVKIYGKTASAKKNDTVIEGRIDPKKKKADASAEITVVKGMTVFFEGFYECRLATDRDASDEKRGTAIGWTFALIGEPDFDRIIRFDAPKVTRSHLPAFVPVKIKKLNAIEPKKAAFAAGDTVIGKAVNLGADNFFAGQKEGFAFATEPIANFKIIIGAAGGPTASGEEDQDLKKKKATRLTLVAGAGAEFLKIEKDMPKVTGIKKYFDDRKKLLETDLDKLKKAGKGASDEAKNLTKRIGNMGAYAQFMQHLGNYNSIPVDKNVAVTPGDSELLKLLKIRDTMGKGFSVNAAFYAYDGDALWGRVRGVITIESP